MKTAIFITGQILGNRTLLNSIDALKGANSDRTKNWIHGEKSY